MTDLQLAVFLDALRNELAGAIAEAREQIAATRDPVQERRHVAADCMGIFCRDETHYDLISVDDPVSELGILDAFSGMLDERIDMLRGPRN